jgi:hypothetical protein
MVTIRTYWNPVEAGLAKSVLDNYEIRCALLDEYSSVNSRGGQLVVPIRLVVDDDEAERAICILNDDLERAADLERAEENDEDDTSPEVVEKANRNPWELLAIAFYLLLPAICLIFTKFPTRALGNWSRYYVARGIVTHFLSWLAALFAIGLIVLYFRIRRSSAKA